MATSLTSRCSSLHTRFVLAMNYKVASTRKQWLQMFLTIVEIRLIVRSSADVGSNANLSSCLSTILRGLPILRFTQLGGMPSYRRVAYRVAHSRASFEHAPGDLRLDSVGSAVLAYSKHRDVLSFTVSFSVATMDHRVVMYNMVLSRRRRSQATIQEGVGLVIFSHGPELTYTWWVMVPDSKTASRGYNPVSCPSRGCAPDSTLLKKRWFE